MNELLKNKNMSLKVIFFNRSFHPDITATGQLLTELCEDLVRDYNCQVTVIAGRPLVVEDAYLTNNFGKKIINQENFKGIEILRVKNTTFSPESFLGRISNYLSYFLLSFIASFKLNKPDLVVTLTDPPIIGLVGVFVSWRFNIPLVISMQDIFPEAARGLNSSGNGILNSMLNRVNQFCLQKASHVVSLGKIMHKKLVREKGLKADRVSIIPDWADSREIFPVSKKNPFSISRRIADYFVVMYSGNIGVSSGLETLVESARLLRDYKDILFVFIGEGIRKKRLIELAQGCKLKNVTFFPYQPREILAYSFSSADIFIVPLKKGLSGYSVPSKLYSILASSRPYIACVEEESEIAQITKTFACGLLSEPENPLNLTKKITFLYENPDIRLKMGENAGKAAIFFDRSSGVKKYYELFQRLPTERKRKVFLNKKQ